MTLQPEVILFLDLLDLPTKPGHDAATGNVDGSLRHAQRRRHNLNILTVNAGPPERMPGRLVKVAANALGGPDEEPAAVLGVEERGVVAFRGRLSFEQSNHVGVSRPVTCGPPLPGDNQVDDQVAGDPEGPGRETSRGPDRIPALNRAGNRAKTSCVRSSASAS